MGVEGCVSDDPSGLQLLGFRELSTVLQVSLPWLRACSGMMLHPVSLRCSPHKLFVPREAVQPSSAMVLRTVCQPSTVCVGTVGGEAYVHHWWVTLARVLC